MAVVTTITRSHNQKRILSRNKGVKIKASVNCKMEIPDLNFPTATGISIGSLTGVMSEKTPSNIIFETHAHVASKKDKDSKKKVPAGNNNTTAYRKSMRLLIRRGEMSLSEKYSSGVPYPFEMPRTVELFNGDPTIIGSEKLKVLYLAGLGLYRRPDDLGMGYQRQLLQEEYENFVNPPKDKEIDSSSETISPSPITLNNNKTSEIASPIKATNKTDGESKLKWKNGSSNWDVNMTVVITPVSQSSNNDFSQISSETNVESDEDTGSPSDCNKSSNTDTEDEGWQSFGSYIEAQISDEIIVNPKCSMREIEEAKLKIANMTKEWNVFLKGP